MPDEVHAHGSMVATLSRSGSGGYGVADFRRYSAWGNVRGANQTGDPKGKYCAALGHRQDDELGTTYMRARYYEPDSGRFLSEDPSQKGSNWFAYASNCPTTFADQSGRDLLKIGGYVLGAMGFVFESMALDLMRKATTIGQVAEACKLAKNGLWCSTISLGIETGGFGSGYVFAADATWTGVVTATLDYLVKKCDVDTMTLEASAGMKSAANAAVAACYLYNLTCIGYEVYAEIGE